jgi:tetratricopeptide (TPR) repeat protein
MMGTCDHRRARRTAAFALLICIAVVGASPQTAQPIVSALRDKNYEQALDLARQTLKSQPRNAQILTLEALALRGLGREQDALAAFRKALGVSPDYLAALEGAAQIEYAAGSSEATALLDHLLKLRPADPTAHAMRGVIAWKQHDCVTAAAHFERSEPALSSQPEALREYGVCMVRLKRLEAAERVFRQLVSASPGVASYRHSLAAVQLMAERPQAALDSLGPILQPGSADPEALALASTAYEAKGDTPNAVATLRQAIVLSPKTGKYYLDFAGLSFAHKSYDAGIQVLNAGLTLAPESSELHLARGILYVQTGQTNQADADFAAAERLDPRQPGTVDARVLERLQVNDLSGAAQLVRGQIKAQPANAFLHYLLAEVLNWQGPPVGSAEFQQALSHAAEAVRLQPDLTLARNLLSRLYMDAGQIKPAIEQCRQVLRTSPHDPVALYRLIRALKMSDDPNAAKELPDIVQKFNEARELSRKQETQENRYRLVEGPANDGRDQ